METHHRKDEQTTIYEVASLLGSGINGNFKIGMHPRQNSGVASLLGSGINGNITSGFSSPRQR